MKMFFYKYKRCVSCGKKFQENELELTGNLEWICENCLNGRIPEKEVRQ